MVSDADLAALEGQVRHAAATGDATGLHLMGFGEVSTVLGWPPGRPEAVCKRLPPFPDQASFDAYAAVVRRYVERLEAAGVAVVPTEVRSVRRDDGRVAGFHVQPALDAATIGTEVLRQADPGRGHDLPGAVVDAVRRATGGRIGVDAQLANWAWLDGEAHQLDLTTPFLLAPDGRGLAIDLAPFLAGLPAPVRRLVRRQMDALVQRWMTPRGALVDVVANLYKERLDGWVDPVLAAANAVVRPPITAGEAAKVHADDRRLWPLLLRLEKLQRHWTRLRGRPYEFVLPEQTTYGR